jgi:hypothetical protein
LTHFLRNSSTDHAFRVRELLLILCRLVNTILVR